MSEKVTRSPGAGLKVSGWGPFPFGNEAARWGRAEIRAREVFGSASSAPTTTVSAETPPASYSDLGDRYADQSSQSRVVSTTGRVRPDRLRRTFSFVKKALLWAAA